MSAHLRLQGSALSESDLAYFRDLPGATQWRKGDARGHSLPPHDKTGVLVPICSEDAEITEQVAGAIEFLQVHGREQGALAASEKCEEAVLSFALFVYPDSVAAIVELPKKLVELAAESGLAIQCCSFLCGDEDGAA